MMEQLMVCNDERRKGLSLKPLPLTPSGAMNACNRANGTWNAKLYKAYRPEFMSRVADMLKNDVYGFLMLMIRV